jgi:hypothetical protein
MKDRTANLFLSAGVILLAALQGYTYGIGDLDTYIPFVLHHFDPSFFPHDLLIETIEDHPVYLWKFLALFLSFMSPETLFKALFFFQIILNTIAVRWFFRQFFGPGRGWIFVLLTLIVSSSSAAMGKYGLNPYGYFHPAALALGAALISCVLIDQGRWIAGGLVAGSVFLFHPFTAIYAGLFLFFRVVLDFRRVSFPRIASGLLAFLLVSSPSWIPHVQKLLSGPTPGFDKALWLELVRMRMQFSFFMSQWVPERFLGLAVALTALWSFRRHPVFMRTLPIILATLVALVTMALAELFSVKFLLQLQLARCSYFLFVLVCFYLADYLFTLDIDRMPLSGTIWLLLGYALMIEEPFGAHDPVWVRFVLILIVLGSLSSIISRRMTWWRPLYIGIGFLMVLFVTGVKVHERYVTSGRMYDLTRTTSWEEIQLWCRENIPKDLVIMTPVYIEGFRCLSWHSIYGSYKDGAPHNYSEKTVFLWWDRMQRLGCVLPLHVGDLPRLYHENAANAARGEGIRYLIYDTQHARYDGPRLFENDRFGIVDLEQATRPEFRFDERI